MPRFTFVGFNPKKPPTKDEIPTHVSVGGSECVVDEDGSIEAPITCEADLKAHGFELRRRPSVTIRKASDKASMPPNQEQKQGLPDDTPPTTGTQRVVREE